MSFDPIRFELLYENFCSLCALCDEACVTGMEFPEFEARWQQTIDPDLEGKLARVQKVYQSLMDRWGLMPGNSRVAS